MITGECFCGVAKYSIVGQLSDARSCHCSRCRRVFSAQASAYALVDPEEFEWTSGRDSLSAFDSGHEFEILFCRHCGSTLGAQYEGNMHGVTLGCVNGDPEVEINRHIFVGSKAPWEILPEGITAFEEGDA
ncbi:MAG: hypothetical protein ACI9HA_001471 [Dinoroseobacter sp.]|jgi:hypothetical protein